MQPWRVHQERGFHSVLSVSERHRLRQHGADGMRSLWVGRIQWKYRIDHMPALHRGDGSFFTVSSHKLHRVYPGNIFRLDEPDFVLKVCSRLT